MKKNLAGGRIDCLHRRKYFGVQYFNARQETDNILQSPPRVAANDVRLRTEQ